MMEHAAAIKKQQPQTLPFELDHLFVSCLFYHQIINKNQLRT